MLKRPINRLAKLARAKLRWRRLAAARVADADLIRVEAVVASCIPEFELVIVRTPEQDQIRTDSRHGGYRPIAAQRVVVDVSGFHRLQDIAPTASPLGVENHPDVFAR